MSWRIQLTQRVIHQLDFLPALPTLLAVWLRRNRVICLQSANGVQAAEVTLPISVDPLNSQLYRVELPPAAPAYLPSIPLPQGTAYCSADGQTLLWHTGGGELRCLHAGKATWLKVTDGAPLVQVAQQQDLIAAIENNGTLHLYRQQRRVAALPLALHITEQRCSLRITPHWIVVTDGQQIVVCTLRGKELKRWTVFPTVGRMAAAGSWLVYSDVEGVLRIYDAQLHLIRQVFAFDMLEAATPLQLLADLPAAQTGVSQLAVSTAGQVAFAMSGMVCVFPIA
jgi:hypothetical protein